MQGRQQSFHRPQFPPVPVQAQPGQCKVKPAVSGHVGHVEFSARCRRPGGPVHAQAGPGLALGVGVEHPVGDDQVPALLLAAEQPLGHACIRSR